MLLRGGYIGREGIWDLIEKNEMLRKRKEKETDIIYLKRSRPGGVPRLFRIPGVREVGEP